jgi:hypothetical protein
MMTEGHDVLLNVPPTLITAITVRCSPMTCRMVPPPGDAPIVIHSTLQLLTNALGVLSCSQKRRWIKFQLSRGKDDLECLYVWLKICLDNFDEDTTFHYVR